jgi:HD-like signal output (HDOD) protein
MRKSDFITATEYAAATTGNDNVPAQVEAISFVQELASEVAGGVIELPSYPDVALQVQRVLVDANAGEARVVKAISSEPVLAARVITMANSAALNPSGRPVADLRSALNRVGFDALRSAVFSFAMAQLRKAPAYGALQQPMAELWQRSTSIAASSKVLSRALRCSVPDTAMLAGLLSGVGQLYILVRGSKYRALSADSECRLALVRDWQSNVARSLLENWSMAAEVVDAVADSEFAPEDSRSEATLADLISCASAMVGLGGTPEVLQLQLAGDRAARRIGLTADNCTQLLRESADEVAALRAAL